MAWGLRGAWDGTATRVGLWGLVPWWVLPPGVSVEQCTRHPPLPPAAKGGQSLTSAAGTNSGVTSHHHVISVRTETGPEVQLCLVAGTWPCSAEGLLSAPTLLRPGVHPLAAPTWLGWPQAASFSLQLAPCCWSGDGGHWRHPAGISQAPICAGSEAAGLRARLGPCRAVANRKCRCAAGNAAGQPGAGGSVAHLLSSSQSHPGEQDPAGTAVPRPLRHFLFCRLHWQPGAPLNWGPSGLCG